MRNNLFAGIVLSVAIACAGSQARAETTVRRTVAASEGVPLILPEGFGSQTVTLHWIPGADSVAFTNVFNNAPEWTSGSVTISGSCCPFNGKTKLNDPNIGTLFIGKHTYFCALRIAPAAGAQTTIDSAVYVSDCGSNVLTEEGWIFFTIQKTNQYGSWFSTKDIASGANAAATLTCAYAIDLTQMQADGVLDDISIGHCMELFARRELKPGQNGAAVTRPRENGKVVQRLTVTSAAGRKVYRHVDGAGTASLTVSAGETLTVDNGTVVFRADMPVPANYQTSDWSPYRWGVIGDSLTDPTLDPVGGKYHDILARSTGIRTFVSGKGSTGYWALNDSGLAFYQRLKTLPADVDVVTVFGSVNDWKYYQKSVPIGTAADSLATTESVCAYINAAIDEIQKRAPLAKIILCTGLYYFGVNGTYHGNANQAVLDVAAARGIECHDWLNGQNDAAYDFHRINRDTYGADFASRYTRDFSETASAYGHPSAAYNEEWLAPAFSNLLNTAVAGLASRDGEPAADTVLEPVAEEEGEEVDEGGDGEDEGEEVDEGGGQPQGEDPQVTDPQADGDTGPEPEPEGPAIYVNCAAAPGGDGTREAPFQTIAEGIAATATTGISLVLVAEGTYPISAILTVDSAITVRGAGKDRTVVDGQASVRGLTISHADAVVENLTVTDCASSSKVSGVGVAISSGILRNCRIANCSAAAHDSTGVGVYLSGTALVTGCVIENMTASKRTTGYGAYLNGAATVLEGTLVTGCTTARSVTTNLGTVYVKAGTVRNCTIVGNKLVANAGLYLADSADAKAFDTIVWGNEDWEDANALAPNLSVGAKATAERICAPLAAPQDPYAITDDPRFTDAANGDYTLRPGSPCISPPVGAFPFDATTPSYGLTATDLSGVDSLETTLSVTTYGSASVASVAWTVDGQPAGSSTELTRTFGPGFHAISATVTPTEGAAVTVTETDFVKVFASDVYVNAQSADPVAPYTTPDTAATTFDAAFPFLATNGTMHIAAGTYTLAEEYHVRSPQRFIGENRETTILKPRSGGYRHFNLCHADALLAGVKVTGGSTGTSRYGSALYVSAGVVSNCWVTGNSLSSGNLHGGAMYLAGADARVTRSLITDNKITGGSSCKGMAVYMTNGIIDNSLFCTNAATAGNKSGFLGGGIYMSGGKVLNCTFAGNSCGQGPGVYAAGGVVANSILYGNTVLGSGDPNWGGTASCFVNCCTVNAVGSGCVTVSDAPYQDDYALAQGSPCIDRGDDAYLGDEAAADYFGEVRLLGDSVDIGASEYRPSATMSVSVTCSPQSALPGDEIVVSASVEGAGIVPEQCVYVWTLDGERLTESAAIFTNTLAVGQHTVGLSVTCGSLTADAEPAVARVFPETIYVAEGGSQEFPYDTRENAFTNVADAVATALSGMTVHVCEGRWRIFETIVLDGGKNLQIVGDGMDKTTIYRNGGAAFRLFEMNAAGSRLADLALTGGYSLGGGVYAHDNGGVIERCRIYGCTSSVNSDGGGVSLSGPAAVLRQSIVSNNTATISTGQMRGGGGVKLNDGAVCENCLIIDNLAQSGAGVLLSEFGANRLVNCTLIGNHSQSNRSDCVCSAVYAKSGTVENCIILDSYDSADSDNPHVAGEEGNYFNCFLPLDYGEGCVVGDSTTARFQNYGGGDYRLKPSSPCRDRGLTGEWMAGAVDFYGQPRVHGKYVDIGAAECQQDSALAIILR